MKPHLGFPSEKVNLYLCIFLLCEICDLFRFKICQCIFSIVIFNSSSNALFLLLLYPIPYCKTSPLEILQQVLHIGRYEMFAIFIEFITCFPLQNGFLNCSIAKDAIYCNCSPHKKEAGDPRITLLLCKQRKWAWHSCMICNWYHGRLCSFWLVLWVP